MCRLKLHIDTDIDIVLQWAGQPDPAKSQTVGHFLFRWDQSLRLQYETKQWRGERYDGTSTRTGPFQSQKN